MNSPCFFFFHIHSFDSASILSFYYTTVSNMVLPLSFVFHLFFNIDVNTESLILKLWSHLSYIVVSVLVVQNKFSPQIMCIQTTQLVCLIAVFNDTSLSLKRLMECPSFINDATFHSREFYVFTKACL